MTELAWQSVTAGNTVLYRWWQLTWQCLLQLVTQLVIAFEAADETKSVVTSATNYVSCFLSKLSQLMCQCKSPAQRVRREWHCSYHSAMTLLVTLLVPQRNDIARTTAQWHWSYHRAMTLLVPQRNDIARTTALVHLPTAINKKVKFVWIEIFTELLIRVRVLWFLTPCWLVTFSRVFRDACCLYRQGSRRRINTALYPRRLKYSVILGPRNYSQTWSKCFGIVRVSKKLELNELGQHVIWST